MWIPSRQPWRQSTTICSMMKISALYSKSRWQMRLLYRLGFYTRAGFVAFMALVRSRHETSKWSDFFERFVDTISKENPTSLQSQWAQELYLQLHLQGLYTSYVLQETRKSPPAYVPVAWPNTYHQTPFPHSIALVFRIPHTRLDQIIGEFNPIEAKSDIVLQVTVSSPPVSNTYSVIQAAFGRNAVGLPTNWSDPNDLIVYLHIPAWTVLTGSRKSTEISLGLHFDVWTIRKYLSTMGPELSIFRTSIWNTEYVMPMVAEQVPSVSDIATPVFRSSTLSFRGFISSPAKFNRVNGQLEMITHIDVSAEDKKSKLTAGDQVKITQKSPCTFCLHLGNSGIDVPLPFPALASTSRIRVARKSGWIEVITPVVMDPSQSSFNFTTPDSASFD